VGPEIIVTVYVNNILIIGKNRTVINLFKKSLNAHFKIKNLGEAVNYLGIEIKQNASDGTITLSQKAYIKSIIRKFELENSKPVYMPVSPGLSVDLFNTNIPLLSAPMQTKYRSRISSLTYAMQGTRPDIAYSVSLLSRFLAAPTDQHYALLIRILKYLNTYPSLGIQYRRSTDQSLICYTDAT
jgi:hypothetical protein